MFCAGMVGNYNGNVTDDVVFRNGTLVPLSEFSFRLLHQVGLSCELLTYYCFNSLCVYLRKYVKCISDLIFDCGKLGRRPNFMIGVR